MKIRFAALAVLPLLLAACESLSKGADNIRDLANHEPEHVTYPSLLDVPAKPAPLNTAADRKQTVESLKGDQAAADRQRDDLRDAAANMQIIPVPGQPTQTPAPQSPATHP